LVDVAQGGELLQRIKSLRRQLAQEMGFVIPAIHIRDNLQLKPNQYCVILKGVEIARGDMFPGHWLALTSDKAQKVKGIDTKEPAFGLPAVWITEKEKESVQARGIVVVDPATVVTTHLTELIKSNSDELLGRQEVQSLVDNLAKTYPRVVEELVPKMVSVGTIHRVLQRLLRERISIRDLLSILETLADYAPMTKNIDILTGYVRQALSRSITRQYRDGEGNITVVMLSPEIEDKISHSIQHTEFESFLSVDPNWVQKVVRSVQKYIGTFTSRGLQPIILCSPGSRIHFRKILEKFFPNIIVLSHNEITHDVNIKSLGIVE
jgi:flagellar biosynthesis protein FlhA